MLVHAVFFKDLHTRNLIYDGRQWQIIDSQSPKAFDAPRHAWDKLYTSLYLGELTEPTETKRRRVRLPVSKVSGGILPGVDLNRLSALADLMDT